MKEFNQKLLLDVRSFFEENKTDAFYVKEISERLNCHSSVLFKQLIRILAFLEEEKEIRLLKSGKFQRAKVEQPIEGYFRSNEKGFGFVVVEGQEEDIFIGKSYTLNAMDGDVVRVSLLKSSDLYTNKSAEGKIIEIIERKTQIVVGVFTKIKQLATSSKECIGQVLLSDKKLSSFSCLVLEKGLHPVEGSVVQLEITSYAYDGRAGVLCGVIVKELGHKNDVGMDIQTVLLQHGIPTQFPEAVLVEANSVDQVISQDDLKGRKDYRKQLIVTIDGADAKDLDDAISITKRADGTFELGVHIADVSHYVKENSALDEEAYVRGTSVYLADRVVPMLPQRLSNGICSLNPREDRLTMSCVMEIDRSGTIYGYEIHPSVICSSERLTYQAVNQFFEGDTKVHEQYAHLAEMFEALEDLHTILERRRRERGAISFETHEAKVVVDEKGKATDILVRERGLSEKMIESFMLAANETVAKHFEQLNVPFVYRIHEQPHAEKMQRFLEFITTFGIVLPGKSESITPKRLQKALDKVKGETYEAVVSTMMLRSLKQARYDIVPDGHYGLAAKDYTHFTSPIRRYPDLIVHRMIRHYQQPEILPLTKEHEMALEAKLQDIADHSSKMERRSVLAEREVEAMKKAEFMMDKVGQEFEGIISSVTKFGMFIELPNTIEGLIHMTQMKEDYFNFIESHLLLIGERTGKTYRIGDRVRVKLTKVDVQAREIDFMLVEDAKLQEDIQQMELRKKAKEIKKTKDHTRLFVKKEKNKVKKKHMSSRKGGHHAKRTIR